MSIEGDIEKLKKAVMAEARDRRDAAGLNGRGIDGADELEDQVRFYTYGQHGALPPEWEKYEHRLDPEYETYLRLKEKFGE